MHEVLKCYIFNYTQSCDQLILSCIPVSIYFRLRLTLCKWVFRFYVYPLVLVSSTLDYCDKQNASLVYTDITGNSAYGPIYKSLSKINKFFPILKIFSYRYYVNDRRIITQNQLKLQAASHFPCKLIFQRMEKMVASCKSDLSCSPHITDVIDEAPVTIERRSVKIYMSLRYISTL